MSEERPDPDRLLEAARASEARRRGRLKVFLGAAAGVGKTCAMLDAAHEARKAGARVLVGIVEHHGRAHTLRRLEGLDLLPRRPGPPPDLDLDAAVEQRPDVLLIDELAHTNASGGRHPKRWQDVEELRDAGIDVWTTLNVQHLESVNDLVERLTGVVVHETVPDALLDGADEIELVDLPPDELLARLREGKIYPADAAARALAGFFSKGNLLALRELALRRAAERVGEQVDDFRDARARQDVWTATDRLLVGVGGSPLGARAVRVAARLARGLDAPWHALLVRTPALRAEEGALDTALAHLRLAEQLGAEATTVDADDPADALVEHARRNNLTMVVLGASLPSRAAPPWRRALAERVAQRAGELQVHVVPQPAAGGTSPAPRPRTPRGMEAWAFGPGTAGLVVASVGTATLLNLALFDVFSESDVVMVFLAAVVLVAFLRSRGAAALAVIGAIASMNYFFTEPYHTFRVADARYLATFLGIALFGALVTALATRARERARSAEQRAGDAHALYRMGRALAGAADPADLALLAARSIGEAFGTSVTVRVAAGEELEVVASQGPPLVGDAEEATAGWAQRHGRPAGRGTGTLPGSAGQHVPMVVGQERLGVVGFRPEGMGLDDPDRHHLLVSMVDQLALALARDRLAARATDAARSAEAERVRSSLLASVSHDLRTPLAGITGAATTLLDRGEHLDAPTRTDLLTQIAGEAVRLERLLENLLQLTRLDAGALRPSLDWQVAQDLVGAAVARVRREAGDRALRVEAPEAPVMMLADASLLDQALVNLVENALRHAPGAHPIDVGVEVDAPRVRLVVADRGPGVPEAQRAALFHTFTRGQTQSGGAGLGLAIVQAVAVLHGGEARVEARVGGGARFVLDLPLGGPDNSPTPELS